MSDDSPLTPEDRAMLDAARRGSEPNAADRARVRTALIAQLGVGVGLGTAVTSASTAASASAGAAGAAAGGAAIATSLVGAKIVALVALVGVIGAAGVTVAVRTSSQRAPTGAIASSASAARSAPSMIPIPEPAATPAPSSAPLEPPPVRVAPTSSAIAAHGASARTSSLEDETRLVGGGAAALREGRPAEALALLDEHARTYPRGTLAEERSAERILALCALGRVLDARIDADRFLRDRPASPLAPRVRTSCAGSPSSL